MIPLSWRAKAARLGAQADKILDVLPHFDPEKSVVEKAVGAIAAVGKLAGVGTEYPAETLLKYQGYTRISMESEVESFMVNILANSDLDRETIPLGTDRIDLFRVPGEPEDVAPLAIYLDSHNPWEKGNVYALEGFDPRPLMATLVWEQGDSLMLTAKNQNWRTLYSLKAMEKPGDFVGEPGAQYLIDRLQRSERATRSLLLVGPTGSGKSTLARLVSAGLSGSERTLKVSSDALKMCEPDGLIDLLTACQPNVLLLDDIPIEEEFAPPKLLALYEALYGKTKVIITTFMDDSMEEEPEDGSLYYSGMRPGRIDEVHRIRRPNKDHRKQILMHYLRGVDAPFDDIAKATKNLTGAYLAEIAHRVKMFGVENWEEEVLAVRRTAPISQDDDEDGPKKPTRKKK